MRTYRGNTYFADDGGIDRRFWATDSGALMNLRKLSRGRLIPPLDRSQLSRMVLLAFDEYAERITLLSEEHLQVPFTCHLGPVSTMLVLGNFSPRFEIKLDGIRRIKSLTWLALPNRHLPAIQMDASFHP